MCCRHLRRETSVLLKPGLAVHKCGRHPRAQSTAAPHAVSRNTRSEDSIPLHRQTIECRDCGRRFSRPSDMKRHECVAERAKLACRGAVQCDVCHKWLLSKGGLTVHKCTTNLCPDVLVIIAYHSCLYWRAMQPYRQ